MFTSQNTSENAVTSTTDVPGPSWAGVDEDVPTTNEETRSTPETCTSEIEALAEASSSHNDLRQRRIERFSSQPNNDQEEE